MDPPGTAKRVSFAVFPYRQILLTVSSLGCLLTVIPEAGAHSSAWLFGACWTLSRRGINPQLRWLENVDHPHPAASCCGAHIHITCTHGPKRQHACTLPVPGCESVCSGVGPLGKWEDVPRPCCEWAPVPGAVGTGSGVACLVAVETGWLWRGSGAQAWQLELELCGSSRAGP